MKTLDCFLVSTYFFSFHSNTDTIFVNFRIVRVNSTPTPFIRGIPLAYLVVPAFCRNLHFFAGIVDLERLQETFSK